MSEPDVRFRTFLREEVLPRLWTGVAGGFVEMLLWIIGSSIVFFGINPEGVADAGNNPVALLYAIPFWAVGIIRLCYRTWALDRLEDYRSKSK